MSSELHADALLEVKGLKKYFAIERGFFKKTVGYIKAVDDVNLFINRGEALGLVGESGCGKTTLGRCILRAIEPTEGSILLQIEEGKRVDLTTLSLQEMYGVRRHAQMIFQDPYSSLDPRMTVMDIIAEPLRSNNLMNRGEVESRVRELISIVGLEVNHLNRYPHAFSGGQRQRIGIARALAPSPKLIIADEPVSALDVSIQAQILNLLQDLQEQFHLTYLLISHDLKVVEHTSDRVAVMYVGKMVELARTEDLYRTPRHPYTEALLSAAPKITANGRSKRIILPGEVANPASPPSGCYFHPRCLYAKDICKIEEPAWREAAPGHFSACHFGSELSLRGVEDEL